MCGIVGIKTHHPSKSLAERIDRMLAPIAHRGPDGEGMWVDPAACCGLGHKRLAIIDPQGGHQPIANEDESLWIIFNGCIYNYRQLQGPLRDPGHRVRTSTGTEVILHAYAECGE